MPERRHLHLAVVRGAGVVDDAAEASLGGGELEFPVGVALEVISDKEALAPGEAEGFPFVVCAGEGADGSWSHGWEG